MRVRLKDVAAHAGVSIKTVSNVVNGYPYISGRMRERVERAIAELDYHPNLYARSLRNGRSGVIALALPDLQAPYFAEIAHAVVQAAEGRGWTVLVDETGGDPERERVVAAGIRGHLIDGLIFSPLGLSGRDLPSAVDLRTPLVLIGERAQHGTADHVAIDNVAAAREATAHLVSTGRRRIAAIGLQHRPEGATARLRQRGYRQALAEAGIEFDEQRSAQAPEWRRSEGAAAMRRLLAGSAHPDAVFCFNDLLALGALHALREAGVGVPDDVAVVGVDDIEESQYAVPALSTVAPDKSALARTAVDLLAERLATTEQAPPRQVFVDHRLVVRASSADSQ